MPVFTGKYQQFLGAQNAGPTRIFASKLPEIIAGGVAWQRFP